MYRDRPLYEPLAPRSDAQQFSLEVRLEGLWILRCGGPVVQAGPPPQVGYPLASRISTLLDGDVWPLFKTGHGFNTVPAPKVGQRAVATDALRVTGSKSGFRDPVPRRAAIREFCYQMTKFLEGQ